MMLISTEFDKTETFKLIPLTLECPYVECLYVPQENILVVSNKQTKEGFHFLPRLDGNGYPERKQGKVQEGENPFKQQRVELTTNFEYYISKPEEIEAFIGYHAHNSEKFDFKKFFKEELEVVENK